MRRAVILLCLCVLLFAGFGGCKSDNAVNNTGSGEMIEKDFSNLAFRITIPDDYVITEDTDTLARLMPQSERYEIYVYKLYSPSDAGYPDFSDWPEEEMNIILENYKAGIQGYFSEYKCDFNAVETIDVGDRTALHFNYDGQLREEFINDKEYEGLPQSFTEGMYIFSDYGHIYEATARIEDNEFTSDDVALINQIINSIDIY